MSAFLILKICAEKLLDEPFYLMHVNVFTITTDNEVFPAELSVAEFTLRAGVARVFHRFFPAGNFTKPLCSVPTCPILHYSNPFNTILAGKLPMGYEYTVREHAKKTHRISTDFAENEAGYLGLYAKFCRFLKVSVLGLRLLNFSRLLYD